jgi:hypothetical protein
VLKVLKVVLKELKGLQDFKGLKVHKVVLKELKVHKDLKELKEVQV